MDTWTVRDTCLNLERLLPPLPPHLTCAAGHALPLRNSNQQVMPSTATADACEAACSADRSCVALMWQAHNSTCVLGLALGAAPDQGVTSVMGPAWWATWSCVNVTRLVSSPDAVGHLQYDGQWMQCGRAAAVSAAMVNALCARPFVSARTCIEPAGGSQQGCWSMHDTGLSVGCGLCYR